MEGIKICAHLKDEINTDKLKKAHVHSVFNKTINLIANKNIITLLEHEGNMGPMCILVSSKKIKNLNIHKGEEVKLSKDKIEFLRSANHIQLLGARSIDFNPVFTYEKETIARLFTKLELLEETIYKLGNLEGIGRCIFNLGITSKQMEIDQYSRFILPRVKRFVNICINKEAEKISRSIKEIVGFGPGLTPSTDDFLMGLIASFIYLNNHFDLRMNKFNEMFLKDIDGKTTMISENLLKWASKGKVSYTVRNSLIAFLSTTSINKFNDRIIDLLEIGKTSGTDIACGIYIAFKIILGSGGVEN